MGLSVEENVLRCIRKFGACVTHPATLRQMRWQTLDRLRPSVRPPKTESAETVKDK
jgi:hypothetical protein